VIHGHVGGRGHSCGALSLRKLPCAGEVSSTSSPTRSRFGPVRAPRRPASTSQPPRSRVGAPPRARSLAQLAAASIIADPPSDGAGAVAAEALRRPGLVDPWNTPRIDRAAFQGVGRDLPNPARSPVRWRTSRHRPIPRRRTQHQRSDSARASPPTRNSSRWRFRDGVPQSVFPPAGATWLPADLFESARERTR